MINLLSEVGTRFIAEVGSSHLGDIARMFQFVERAKELNLDAVKFQLFPNRPPYIGTDLAPDVRLLNGNVWLDPILFKMAYAHGEAIGIPVSASVFDEESFKFLLDLKPKFIKFSYSKKDQVDWINQTIDAGIEAIVSCDIMTDKMVPNAATKLYCIPEYPVRYQVDFSEIFPRFTGFSDHTLGTNQTMYAACVGAKVIEKHVKLNSYDFNCPDDMFAVTIEEFAKINNYKALNELTGISEKLKLEF